jgi:hypothetical protein
MLVSGNWCDVTDALRRQLEAALAAGVTITFVAPGLPGSP